MENFIHWEQAVKMDVMIPVAEKYEQQLMEVLKYFAKNTLAQMLKMDLYMDALELHAVYQAKDYSDYLFKKTEQVFDEFDEIVPAIQQLTPSMQEMAKKYTESKIESQIKNLEK